MHDDTPWMPPTDEDGERSTRSNGDAPTAPRSLTSLPSPAISAAPPPPPPAPAISAAPPPPAAPGFPSVPPPSPSSTTPTPTLPPASYGPRPSMPFPTGDGSPVPGPVEVVPSAGAGGRSRRSRRVVAGAVAGVVAVGAAGVFAVTNLGSPSAGGASTPDELGAEILAALENEDVLGAVDILLPGERDVLREPLLDLVAELTRLEVLAVGTDLSGIAGIDIELAGERVDVRSTNVDDIVNLDLRADVTATLDGAALPIGDLIIDNMPDELVTEMRGSRETTTEELDISVTAVEEDGRWYLSLFHTAAEAARRSSGSPEIPLAGIGADGADTPEAAVDQLFQRVEDLDLTGLLRTLDPGEAAALQRYAPLFLDEAQQALDAAPVSWRITEREVRIEGSGDGRTVFLDAIALEGDVDGTSFSFSARGDCFSADLGGENLEACAGDVMGMEELDEMFGDVAPIQHLFETIGVALEDLEPGGLELREHDGRWYVSPTATLTEATLKLLRALDRDELDRIIEAVPPAIDSFSAALFGSFGAIDDGSFSEEMGSAEPTESAEPAEEDAPDWFGCYDERDPAAAGECFRGYVESGAIDELSVPVELRFPDCGFGELAWDGGLYSLGDAEFIAAVEAVRPCFLDLIEQGAVETWELPNELTHLDCFEGRNWYRVYDDPDYEDRFQACVQK